MKLNIRRTYITEADELLAVQKLAFMDDLEKYKDFKTNPATEPIERLIYKINKNIHYTVLLNGLIIGGAEIRLDCENECYINRIFLAPEYQNIGLGKQIMNFIESEYPLVTKWTLCTPHKNFRSQHFYEKLGYKKVGEHMVSESLNLFSYLKF